MEEILDADQARSSVISLILVVMGERTLLSLNRSDAMHSVLQPSTL